MRLVWQAEPRATIKLCIIVLFSALLPLAQAYTGKLIVDAVLQAVESLSIEAAARLIWPFLALEFFLFAAASFLALSRRLSEQVLEQRAGHRITEAIIEKALRLPLPYFEDSRFYDGMQKARREAEYRALAITGGLFSLCQNAITLLSFAFVLLAMTPLAALILFSASIPAFAVQARYSKLKFRLQGWQAPESRMITYLEQVLTLDSTVKEIKLFRLGRELLGRFNSMFNKIFAEDLALAQRRLRISYAWSMLSTVSFYACYAWILYLTVSRKITLGDMTLYLAAVRQSQGSFQGLMDQTSRLYENGLFMDNLFTFLEIPDPPAAKTPTAPARAGAAAISIRGVTFRYPGAAHAALEDVTLDIAPGEKIALVGENGSGKTTLIKLLTGLYKPEAGELELDGTNIADIDIADLHEQIGVIFQDYVRYQLTLAENVGFGSVSHLKDEERIKAAIRSAGAEDVLSDLPDGLSTVLGSQFKGGRELSGGQWQKVALARAFMRSARILILDEPTSALDAEREYEIFQRFKRLTEGKTAILISHRFSTVRMADRIGVLEKGRLVELGSHEELLDQNGRYARLFEMQAQGYR